VCANFDGEERGLLTHDHEVAIQTFQFQAWLVRLGSTQNRKGSLKVEKKLRRGKGGEMTQTSYAHMNKRKKKTTKGGAGGVAQVVEGQAQSF
jgi:hypothetical protein